MTEEILVPTPRMLRGKLFYSEGEYGVADALESCLKAGYEPLYMPELADTRIAASPGDRILQVWYIAPSVKATGRGKSTNTSHKGGTEFVVYGNVPNYFSKPQNIRITVERSELINGAGIMPPEEFQKLLDSEDDERVFVRGRDDLKKWPSGLYGIDEPTKEHMRDFGGKIDGKDMIAINHPQTKVFLTPKRAEPYLQMHRREFGEIIGIWHSDDLADKPLGRLLMVGGYSVGLGGDNALHGDGRFAGVHGADGAAPKKAAPTEEQVRRIIGEFVATCNQKQKEVEERISALYKQTL